MANRLDHLVSRSRINRRVIASLALGLPLGTACSLMLELGDEKKCSSDDECVYTEGQGSCVDGFCRPPGNGETSDPTTGPGEGSTTSTGTDSSTTSADDDSSTGIPTVCMANSECGEDQRCGSDGTCQDLLSAECTILRWPDSGRDNVEFLGSILPTSTPFEDLVQPLENAHQLAIDDFNEYTTLQDGQKIAWVGCDSTAGADAAVAATTHLRDIGVQAIVGPAFSEAVRAAAEQVAVPAGMFIISPTASAPSLSNFDDDNLVWRVTPNDVYQGNALIDRFMRDNDLNLDPASSRLLVLYKDDAYGNELFSLIGPDLQSQFGDNIFFREFDPPQLHGGDPAALQAAYAPVLSDALSQDGVTDADQYVNPEDHYTHILIIGTSEVQVLISSYLGLWAQFYFAMNPAIPLPLIMVSHGAVPTMEEIVAGTGVIPGTEPLEPFRPLLFSNMRGTSPDIFDPDNFSAFNFRYEATFNDQEAVTSSSLSYDAAMATMFAMATVPAEDEITGAAIAAGMANLNDPDGTFINFDNNVGVWIQDARNTLAAGGTVDLQGVSGALNWDPSNGEIRADVLGWNLLGTDTAPILNPYCRYLLDAEPATEGTWLGGSGMPPCGL